MQFRTEQENDMNRIEAKADAAMINATGVATAELVRILPERIDPIQPDDNGWDVEVTVLDEEL